MDDQTKKKLLAAGKIALGAARVGSGVLLATGHGMLGAFMRNHNMLRQATLLGRNSVLSGKETFEEGMKEWERLKK